MEAELETFPQHIRRFTIDEFDRLMEIGLIALRAYELMDGIVYNTSGFARHWSLRDYELMAKAGILTWDEHAELVDGYIVTLPRATAIQASIRCRSHEYLFHALNKSILFSGAGHSIVFDDANLVCPDFCMLRWQDDYYRDAWPRAGDVFALMDVSVSPLIVDSEARRRQFARFAVPEFWHADGAEDVVTVYRAPVGAEYTDVRTYGHGESFETHLLGGIVIPVDGLIGPARDVSPETRFVH